MACRKTDCGIVQSSLQATFSTNSDRYVVRSICGEEVWYCDFQSIRDDRRRYIMQNTELWNSPFY